MNNNKITSELLGQSYSRIEHSSGLTILVCPMEGFSTSYALFAAKVGSIDATFKTQHDSEFVTVPAGIAHFLEHKMFESEEGDTFAKYARTGASANAYTSFDRTAYLFSCTENFGESLEILLHQVSHPYFTPDNVAKEQGIIGQEIRMYDDDPGWRVMFNLFESLYHYNPIKVDIAGTVESISEITADLLYRCYNTFYNLGNMVLAVAGNITESEVLALADKHLSPAEPITIDWQRVPEPVEVVKPYVEQSLPVAVPLFHLGFKGKAGSPLDNLHAQVVCEVLMEVICGESTELYRKLYDGGLISSTFEDEVIAGRDYLILMFCGESREPRRVAELICAEIERMRREGIPATQFERCRKANYGRYISMYCKASSVAGLLTLSHFSGLDSMYELLDYVGEITLDEANRILQESFDPAHSSLSVINPV